MRPLLLDINVLLALAWQSHEHHVAASSWFEQQRHRGWGTCPITEAGFLRVSLHWYVPEISLPFHHALDLLKRIRAYPGHQFWPNDLSPVEIRPERITGHNQINDAYLFHFAKSKGATLVTFDARIRTSPEERGFLELIPISSAPSIRLL